MKKIFLFAVTVLTFITCGNRTKSGETTADSSTDSVAAVIDSIIEENDTTPMPMFLMGEDDQYALMLYWSNLEEPKKSEDFPEYFEADHQRWALQEMFRRHKEQYTNMLMDDKFVKIKFIDEVLKDPDGDTPSIGEIHGRKEIPSLCSRFDFVNPKDKKKTEYGGYEWGTVIVTDSYLHSRKRLDVKSCQDDEYNYPNLPADIVKQFETKYGMKAQASHKTCTIGDRYTMGSIEFKGQYKNAPKDPYNPDRKFALALELLVDGGKIFVLEQLGYYDPEEGASWNADADGYIPNHIVAAFEGPKGLELCYYHGAPESSCIGMLFPRERPRVGDGTSGMDKLIEMEYEGYHNMVDEEIPVWRKDFAEMKKLYLEQDPHANKNVELTKWTHCYIDYDNEWIWLRDKDDKNGAIFIRKDGKFRLIDVENAYQSPSRAQKDGISYLKFSGSPGGPSMQHIIYAFKDGKQLWKLFALEMYGELSECMLNDKEISKEVGQTYLDKVPEGEVISGWFNNIDSKEN